MINLLISLLIQIAGLSGTPTTAPQTDASASAAATTTTTTPPPTTRIGDDKWDND